MRYLSTEDVLRLHEFVVAQSGGSPGLRDRSILESAVAQPSMSFGGEDLYDTLFKKTAALGFSLIQNHPFVDGNKRIGHAAMEVFLLLNGYEFTADVDELEEVILNVAASQFSREDLVSWVTRSTTESSQE